MWLFKTIFSCNYRRYISILKKGKWKWYMLLPGFPPHLNSYCSWLLQSNKKEISTLEYHTHTIKNHTCSVASCVWLFATPWTVAHQAPLSMEFSRHEYRSGLLFPSPGDLPNPVMEPGSPAIAGWFLTTWPNREARYPKLPPFYTLWLHFLDGPFEAQKFRILISIIYIFFCYCVWYCI